MKSTLSGIPMVGYRNRAATKMRRAFDFIRHSDGGVSELAVIGADMKFRLYQAFRWWGIGTS